MGNKISRLQHVSDQAGLVADIVQDMHLMYEQLLRENQELKEEIATYRGTGGEIAMERSWKVKYRLALQRANKRLLEAGLQQETIRNRSGQSVLPDEKCECELDVEENGQMAFKTDGSKG